MATALALDEAIEILDPVDAARRARDVERAVFREVFAPRVRMSLLEWSESRRMLSPEANALAADAGAPVHYTTSITPYHREVMDALSDPRTEIVVCKFPSQDGKTEIANNFVGWRIDTEPGPMLMLQPTKEMAEAWSKDRLAPMLRDTPALRGKVRDARSRDADNTILHKKFAGGHLTAVGSNSAAGLAARPIRDVLVDEVDRCAKSAGTEGDSIRLAFRRTTTFRRGKKLLISSPTEKGNSRIDEEYLLGTQEVWQVPCPHCQEYQVLEWGGRDVAYGIKWESRKPRTAFYACRMNGCVIEEHHKAWMIERGRWIAQNPSAGPGRRSFWKNALTSNLVPWWKLVQEWHEVQGKPLQVQQFFNTVLCELFDPIDGEDLEEEPLQARRGVGYAAADADRAEPASIIPAAAGAIVQVVDTQDDRLERAVWAFGAGEEAWLIDWEMLIGDPRTPEPWALLERVYRRTYRHESGAELAPMCTFIDSGGHATKEVYDWTKKRNRQNVFAIKGANTEGHPLLGRPTRNNSARAVLYMVGSFTGKESLMKRLVKITSPGPGFVHLPSWLDVEQVAQFTREKLTRKIVRGGTVKREWVKTGANEQVDLYVYALAALQRFGNAVRPDRLGVKAAELMAAAVPLPPGDETSPPAVVSPKRSGRRQGGWVGGWKR